MGKRIVLGAVLVFVAWAVLDFVIHGVVLRAGYEATMRLWRPQTEIKLGVMYLAVFLTALGFAAIYGLLVRPKSVGKGITFGVLWGLAVGVSFGYASYAIMPIPYWMAFTWFAGSVAEGAVAGLIIGGTVREPIPSS